MPGGPPAKVENNRCTTPSYEQFEAVETAHRMTGVDLRTN
jgi:hypothetical protein